MNAQQLPEEMRFMELIHAHDERFPTRCGRFGTPVIQRLLDRMNKAPQ